MKLNNHSKNHSRLYVYRTAKTSMKNRNLNDENNAKYHAHSLAEKNYYCEEPQVIFSQ